MQTQTFNTKNATHVKGSQNCMQHYHNHHNHHSRCKYKHGEEKDGAEWWAAIQYGVKTHMEKKQARERWISAWGVVFAGVSLYFMIISDIVSSFGGKIFAGAVISDYLFGDGCLFGKKTQIPDWVKSENFQTGEKRKRIVTRRAWRNMYSVDSDDDN
jgi:hypothetical protein